MPNMAGRLSPLRSDTGNPPRRPNNAHSVTRRINTCTTTTVNYAHNCAAKSARLFFRPTIVLKERSKLNIFVLTASTPCSAGKPCCMSLFTNAATTIVLTVSTRLTGSIRQKNFYKKRKRHNSNSATHTANICLRPQISFIRDRSSLPSTSTEFTIPRISSDSSCPSTSPLPSVPERLPLSCNRSLISASPTRPY